MSRDRRARSGLLALLGTMSLGLPGCGQGEDLAGPGPAALRVTTETSGTGTDPDGYSVSVDGRQPVPIALTDTLLESGVTPGDHTIDLGGIAAGCAVEGGGSRTVTAAAGTVASADFAVTCNPPEPAPLGAVLVVLTTSGVDLDPDGYLVAVDPSHIRPVGVSGEERIEGVAAGIRDIRLSGVADNCSVQGENPRSLEVPADGAVGTTFAVRCWPPPAGRIAFARVSEFFGEGRITIIGPDGAPLDEFFPTQFVELPSWSPDGEAIAFSGGPGPVDNLVFVQPISGADPTSFGDCFRTEARLVWSPDSERLLCNSLPSVFGGRLSSIRRDGTDRIFLVPESFVVIAAQYLPDGRVFLAAYEDEDEEDIAAYRVEANGTGLTPLFDLPEDAGGVLSFVGISPDGARVAYFRSRPLGLELHVANLNGTDAHLVSAALPVGTDPPPEWSPDGSRLAFATSQSDRQDLWLVNPDGSDLVSVALPGSLQSVGVIGWSPDGTRLVFSIPVDPVFGDPPSSIYTIRADGTGLERLTASDLYDTDPVWSR